jgi:hypothetical protein
MNVRAWIRDGWFSPFADYRRTVAWLIGHWRGRGLPEEQRCYNCGGPCVCDGGYYGIPKRYDRGFCKNKWCDSWIPF